MVADARRRARAGGWRRAPAVVSGNEQLRHLDSLSELESVGEHLIISANTELLTLDELAELTTVGGNLRITLNFSLPPALAHALTTAWPPTTSPAR